LFTQKEIDETFELLDLGSDESRERYSFELIQGWNKQSFDEEIIISESSSSDIQSVKDA